MAATLRVGRALTVRRRALASCCSNSPAPLERATLCATVRSLPLMGFQWPSPAGKTALRPALPGRLKLGLALGSAG